MKYTLLYILISIILGDLSINAQEAPATEIRAVWLTTNWNLDWPSSPNISVENQQKEFRNILDKLQQANFNTVLFQVRIRGDVFYKSEIEPWSSFFQRSKQSGNFSSYDPLQFAIDECHKRGLDLHAWFVTFPLGTIKQVKTKKNNSIASKRPEICKRHNGEWYLDPGNPDARKYILTLVDELITNYDIDGIHFDYIRYPEIAVKFPDEDTFKKFGKGQKLREWRMQNITDMVTQIYDTVKSKKPWIQVSCSPLGRYRDLDPMRGKWTAYGSVHQDAGGWLQKGKIDAVYPMLYYNETEFEDYVKDWQSVADGRFVVPGLGAYRMLKSEGDWSLDDIRNQIKITKKLGASGIAYYRAGNILDNTKGILDTLSINNYMYPAKIPSMVWLDNAAPNSPLDMQVYRDNNGLVTIEWQSSNTVEEQIYTIYKSDSEEFDIKNAKSIIMTGVRGNKVYLDIPDSEDGVYFSVTASDRFRNESVPCFPVFFIPSTILIK